MNAEFLKGLDLGQLAREEAELAAFAAMLEGLSADGAKEMVGRLRTALRQIESKAPLGQEGHGVAKAKLALAERRLKAFGGNG